MYKISKELSPQCKLVDIPVLLQFENDFRDKNTDFSALNDQSNGKEFPFHEGSLEIMLTTPFDCLC